MRLSAMLSILTIALLAGTLRAAAPAKDAMTAQSAITLAEKFVVDQHFDDLQTKAVGARIESDIWFVGFRSKVGDSIHGITVMNNGAKLKRVSQNLQLNWLMSKPEVIKEITGTEAKVLAEKLAGKKSAKTTENKPNPAGDQWNSWWVWFEKAAKPGSKTKSYTIVSVNKETSQTKWVKSTGKPATP